MKISRYKLPLCTLVSLICSAVAPAAAVMNVYIEAPTVMVTSVSGTVITDTFNTDPAGTYALSGTRVAKSLAFTNNLGTYAPRTGGKFLIQANDQFGGASTPVVTAGQQNQYMVFGAQSGTSIPVDLTLTSSYNYFGFWWSAGDANNGISFYSGNNFLGRIATSDITKVLPDTAGTTVKAVNGTSYQTQSYYGNPSTTNSGQNNGEPYAYVDVIFTSGTFDHIVFDNSGSTGTGFESDNHALALLTTFTPPSTDVYIETLSPEPGTISLVLGAFGFCGLHFLLKRRTSKRREDEAQKP